MKILDVRNISKEAILKDISFEISQGEFVAIMGPSGSGKSTLLYELAGMDRVTAGEIELLGENITQYTEEALAQLRLEKMGFVFQQMPVLPDLSVIDNIMLPAMELLKKQKKNTKQGKKQIEERAREYMIKYGIEEIAKKRTTQISGGQLQRACICRSMINSPKLLFADEPTGALHQQAALDVMKTLLKLNHDGTTIVMVTHDAKVASQCDRILYLLDGTIHDEIILGKYEEKMNKNRDEMVCEWLKNQGW